MVLIQWRDKMNGLEKWRISVFLRRITFAPIFVVLCFVPLTTSELPLPGKIIHFINIILSPGEKHHCSNV